MKNISPEIQVLHGKIADHLAELAKLFNPGFSLSFVARHHEHKDQFIFLTDEPEGEAFEKLVSDFLKDEAAPESKWQPITKDSPALGELVWLYESGRTAPWIGSRDMADSDSWLWGNAYGSLWHNGEKWDADVEQDDDYQPTLFQPLPTLPTIATAGNWGSSNAELREPEAGK